MFKSTGFKYETDWGDIKIESKIQLRENDIIQITYLDGEKRLAKVAMLGTDPKVPFEVFLDPFEYKPIPIQVKETK